jgi:peptide/nickel transport system substrate-binding protein
MRVASFFFLLSFSLGIHAQTTLRIGLAEDPDVLDPTLARTFVGRIVFAGLCDKLFDLDEKLNVVPQLATSYKWSADNKSLEIKLRSGVTFHDGEKMDAEAVKFNLERHKNMTGSTRRGDLAPVASVEVVDPLTVKLNLSSPFAPMLTVLTDRAGMMVSPKAAQAAGEKFGVKPVCSGPFRFVERIAQDRIVLERYPGYWNKGQIHFDRVVYQPIIDATVRLANLRRASSTSSSAWPAPCRRLRATTASRSRIVRMAIRHLFQRRQRRAGAEQPGGLRYVREAFELSLMQAYQGGDGRRSCPGQPVGRAGIGTTPRTCRFRSAMWRRRRRCPPPPASNPSVTLMTPTESGAQRIEKVAQAMAKEAGFDIKIQSTEFASSLALADKGQYEAYVLAWSGRADPDGNLQIHLSCKAALNYPGYCNAAVDELINKARTTLDPAQRAKLYEEIRRSRRQDRRSSSSSNATGFGRTAPAHGLRTIPDGLVRQGLKMNWRWQKPLARRRSFRRCSSLGADFGLWKLSPGIPALSRGRGAQRIIGYLKKISSRRSLPVRYWYWLSGVCTRPRRLGGHSAVTRADPEAPVTLQLPPWRCFARLIGVAVTGR